MAITEKGLVSETEMEMDGDTDQLGTSDRQQASTSASQQSINVHLPVDTWNGDKLRQLGAGKCFFDVIYPR
jgi:hypothetical protein